MLKSTSHEIVMSTFVQMEFLLIVFGMVDKKVNMNLFTKLEH